MRGIIVDKQKGKRYQRKGNFQLINFEFIKERTNYIVKETSVIIAVTKFAT